MLFVAAMRKTLHEFRDPVHVFVHADDDEREIIDSAPVQRLREVHQLAMTYMLYPGATYKRFEHSLGVMELAGKVFDVVTAAENLNEKITELMPEITQPSKLVYWRRAIRMAALCHDIGHLPFSHAAEKELLPSGWDHERLTVKIVKSPLMRKLWEDMTPPLRSKDVAKLAVGQKHLPGERFSDWEAVLSEIIVSDALGVDRMDYLLRDSLHTGVPTGRVDHFRLIETMRILPKPADGGESIEPELGMEQGGLHAAEALLLARYFMFSQVYFHPVRVAYDIHLMDFLKAWLPKGKFSTELDDALTMTDTDVIHAMNHAARKKSRVGYEPARRIMERDHFKLIWRRNPEDIAVNPNSGEAVFKAAKKKFGATAVRRKDYTSAGTGVDFPVLQRDGRVGSARALSAVLPNLPQLVFDYVFVRPDLRERAEQWLSDNRARILKPVREE